MRKIDLKKKIKNYTIHPQIRRKSGGELKFINNVFLIGELSCEPVSGIPGIRHQTVPPAFFPSAGTPDTGIWWSKCI